MEIDFHPETGFRNSSKKIRYKAWQQSRVKWPLYLLNKKNTEEKSINLWDKFIIDNLLPGPVIAWDF